MGTMPKVVVVMKPDLLIHKEEKLVVARFKPLGLTAYGSTPHEATQALKHAYYLLITHLRKMGNLQSCLEKSGVQWQYENDYLKEGKPYEDTTPKDGSERISAKAKLIARSQLPSQWSEWRPEDLAMAA